MKTTHHQDYSKNSKHAGFLLAAGLAKRWLILALAGILLGEFENAALAIVLPVMEDTSTTAGAQNAGGKATSLKVSAKSSALVRFGVSSFSSSIAPKSVKQARLTLYVSSVLKPGSGALLVKKVVSDWHETGAGPVSPTITDTIANLGSPSASYVKQFIVCDITETVTEWLANPATDFGIAIVNTGGSTVLIGSKEGSATGYPAVLEIETTELGGSSTGSSGSTVSIPGSLGIGTTNPAYKLDVSGTVHASNPNGTVEISGKPLDLSDPAYPYGKGGWLAKLSGSATNPPQIRFALDGEDSETNNWQVGMASSANPGDSFSILKNNSTVLTINEYPLGSQNFQLGITAKTYIGGDLEANGFVLVDHGLDVFGNTSVAARFMGDGSQATISLNPFDPRESPAATQISAVDDGAFSAHLDFRTKSPGSGANPNYVRMRITSSGAVGIGNTNPSEQLDVNGNVKADAFVGNGTIPVGGIIMWSGGSVPSGWHLCDGSAGTPDLRGRFVLGSGTGNGLTARSVGNTGGEERHLVTQAEMPIHHHDVSFSFKTVGYAASYNNAMEVMGAWSNPANNGMTAATLPSFPTGGNQSFDKMPVFYVLAFIMRTQ